MCIRPKDTKTLKMILHEYKLWLHQITFITNNVYFGNEMMARVEGHNQCQVSNLDLYKIISFIFKKSQHWNNEHENWTTCSSFLENIDIKEPLVLPIWKKNKW